MRINRKQIVLATAAVAGLAQVGFAANTTWGASPADSFWNTANWDNAGPYTPVAGDSLFFGTSTVTNLTNNFTAGTSFGGLTFNPGASAFTLGGNSIALTGPITVNSGGGIAQTINLAITGAPSILLGSDGSTGNSLALNSDMSIGSLVVSSTGNATANALVIGTGRTVSIGGLFNVGIQNAADTLTRSELTVNGNGTLSVVNTSNLSLLVGRGKTANGATGTGGFGTLNLSGLSNFVYSTSTGTIGFGVGTRGSAIVTLANTFNSLTAPSLSMGVTGGGNANGNSTLNLGAGNNVLNIDNILIGGGKANALVQFAGATGSLTIAGAGGGTTTANITLGSGTSATNSGTPSALLLDGHQVNIQGATVIVGRLAGSTGGTAAAGTVTFDTGNFTVGSLQLATHSSGNNANGAIGAFTLGGAAANNSATGALTVNNQFLMINRTTAGTVATATFTINGGTATINTDISTVDTSPSSTRTAVINLNAGTLNMTGHAIGSAGLPITLNVDGGAFPAVLKNLGGAGLNGAGLNKSGGGILTLDGINTYNGPTIVSAGTLSPAAGAVVPSALIQVNSGAALNVSQMVGNSIAANQTLGGDGTVYGNATVAGTIAPGAPLGTLNFANNLSLTGGGSLSFELSDNPVGSNDHISITGALNLTGTTILKPTALTSYGAGTYNLMNYSSLGGAGTIVLQNLITRQTFALFVQPTQTVLNISGTAPANLVWTGNGTTNVWDHTATLWNNGGSADKFFDLDSVRFDNTGSSAPNINLVGALVPASMTVEGDLNDYVFSGSGSITTSALTKTGNRALTISNSGANSFGTVTIGGFGTFNLATSAANSMGPVTISDTTVNLSNSGALSTGTVQFNSSTVTIANTAPNSMGSVALNNTRVALVGSGGNTVTEMRVNGGSTLQIGNGVTAGLGNLTGPIFNDGSVVLSRPDNYTLSNAISGNGSIQKLGAGVATFSGANTYTGGTTISTGRVIVSNFSALGQVGSGSVNIAAGAQLDLAAIPTENAAGGFGAKEFFIIGDGPDGSGVIVNNGVRQQNAYQLLR
jgi:autotransporter-associated beta strand protein